MPGRRALSHPLALLLMLGLSLRVFAPLDPWGLAFAEERTNKNEDKGDDKGKGDKGDKAGKDNSGSNNKDNNANWGGGNPQGSNNQERRSYYAQVTVNDGKQVYTGSTRLLSDSPWLRLVAPGMWLEASGRWEGNVFRADEVRIVSPKAWAFYRGPVTPLLRWQNSISPLAPYQYAEIWLQDDPNDRLLALRASPETNNQIRLVAYFDGKTLAALPPGLAPVPTGFKPGWLEMLGEWNGQSIAWYSIKPFP
ncbi:MULTISPECIES: hypothetical protein [unclassified Meiothermus]|uniref:hypothetical protein n=1 Tax=unclassified Meiothermus TaxID=370471 RepID=UPI000D7D0E9E|nr:MULTISPECIES: hypothetical protein [unclassified Meiothermus]PZA08474.1 hypothetical protein DNA98_00005 [Meiothermus sp. Pnk-1]RYM36918.1 hypothetical protein EWH23_08265 [Meiothermus sp. PNK-Is4]